MKQALFLTFLPCLSQSLFCSERVWEVSTSTISTWPVSKCAGRLSSLLDVNVVSGDMWSLPSCLFLLYVLTPAFFSPCLLFFWVHSSSAFQFASQTQFFWHCWALCWPLMSTVALTAVDAPQLFSLETTELLFVLQASVDHKNRSSLPQYLLALSCSLIRMKNLSVFKYLSLLIKFFSAAGRIAAQLCFLFISETLVILYCCLLSSYQNCLRVDILFCFWNISCEDLNIFPTALINFLAIIWLKTVQGEKKKT